MVEAPKEDESRVDCTREDCNSPGESEIGDLERYAKLQTCAIEQLLLHLLILCKDSNEKCKLYALIFVFRRLHQSTVVIASYHGPRFRRRLDDSRYHLVQGLMTVLPYKFDEHAPHVRFRPHRRFSSTGSRSLTKVNSIFNSCPLLGAKYNGVFYRYQRYPILSMCYPDQLLQTKGVEFTFRPQSSVQESLTSHPVYLEENHFHVIDKLDTGRRRSSISSLLPSGSRLGIQRTQESPLCKMKSLFQMRHSRSTCSISLRCPTQTTPTSLFEGITVTLTSSSRPALAELRVNKPYWRSSSGAYQRAREPNEVADGI